MHANTIFHSKFGLVALWKFEAYVVSVGSLVKCIHVPYAVIWFVGTVFNGNWEYVSAVKED
jgi:hypothetical protein